MLQTISCLVLNDFRNEVWNVIEIYPLPIKFYNSKARNLITNIPLLFGHTVNNNSQGHDLCSLLLYS